MKNNWPHLTTFDLEQEVDFLCDRVLELKWELSNSHENNKKLRKDINGKDKRIMCLNAEKSELHKLIMRLTKKDK